MNTDDKQITLNIVEKWIFYKDLAPGSMLYEEYGNLVKALVDFPIDAEFLDRWESVKEMERELEDYNNNPAYISTAKFTRSTCDCNYGGLDISMDHLQGLSHQSYNYDLESGMHFDFVEPINLQELTGLIPFTQEDDYTPDQLRSHADHCRAIENMMDMDEE